MLFSTKVISASGNLMLNICDPELVDKTLHDGDTKIKINPNYIDGHINYSTLLLMMGKLEKGFEEYEWRKKSKSFLDYINYNKLNLKSKEWRGENLQDKKLLVISEQGIGDLIQFTRYLFELKKEKVKIILLKVKI